MTPPDHTAQDPRSSRLSPLLTTTQAIAREYRRRKSAYDYKGIRPPEISDFLTQDWQIQRRGKRVIRIKRPKRHDKYLEDRVWCLLRAMDYPVMNGENFSIYFQRSDNTIGRKQVDVYAEDDDTVFVVECKSREDRGRRSLQKDIQETISLQNYFRNTINARFKSKSRPKIIWMYATSNIIWSTKDIERANDGGIHIVTENDLQYYETFLRHMGAGGKYQLLAQFLDGQKIPGLSGVKVPAIRGKIGGSIFYSFVTTPRHLLRIAFVNHQALNYPDGRPAYQRMVSASRIKEIAKFIQGGGFFPTNILVNFADIPRFDLISNDQNTDPGIKFGWITLPSKYRSAWIIDGQHRLYGFSRLTDEFLDQSLFVLAFQKLPVKREADLFITINHKQKSVPRSLLLSLLADIRMGDTDPSTALTALASGIVRSMNDDEVGPLGARFAIPGVPPEPSQNLTISEAVNGLRRSGLVGRVTGNILAQGPLSGATDAHSVDRASSVLNAYFHEVRMANPERWDGGRDCYIATNPGVRAHLSVISEVVAYLTYSRSLDFAVMKTRDFVAVLIEFCRPIFAFIAQATDEDIREKFSRRFGEGGVKEYTYYLMDILSEEHPDFGPLEFRRWMEQSNSDRIDEVNQFLMKLAERLTDYVIDTLKEVHGTRRLESDEQAFWEKGVESERIRKNAFEKQQRDKARRKPKEAYLDIVDLKEIVRQRNNWDHFSHVFNNARPGERKGNKYYLDWINAFNDLRNIAAHKNKLKTYTDDDLEFVDWLRAEISPKVPE